MNNTYQLINSQIVLTDRPFINFASAIEPLTQSEEQDHIASISMITMSEDDNTVTYLQWLESLNGDYSVNNSIVWQSDNMLVENNIVELPATTINYRLIASWLIALIITSIYIYII